MLEVPLALLAIVLCLWVIWRRRKFSVLKNLGIPGPEPSFWFGNMREISSRTPLVCHNEWLKKYGDIYGYYFGTAPVVVIANPDIIKDIQVRDFHKFTNRPGSFTMRKQMKKPGDGFTTQMVHLKDKRWKEIRSTLTPSFTTSKMKTMAPIINSAIDSLIQNIDEKAKKGEWFDIYQMYQGLTMDVIGRTAFGIQTDCQRNPNDPFLRSSRALFSREIKSFLQVLVFSFPEINFLLTELGGLQLSLRNKGVNPIKELVRSVKNVVKARRDNPTHRRQDLLQLMMDARMSVSDIDNATTQDLTAGDDSQDRSDKTKATNGVVEDTNSKHVRHMTDNEIVDNALLFFLAGYETTSTALAFATHFLVHYPEVQERVREEVKDLFEREEKLDYSSVQKLQYLDQVFTESLRLYPPIYLFVNREVSEDVTIGNFRLKKGMAVQIPVYHVQRDERFWPEPHKFDPDRFSPENKSQNHPFAFQAFGAGPRNCVGMRFAQMEAKLALARILLKYRLEKCEKTDKLDITLKSAAAIITPRNGINLKAVPL